MAGVFSASSCSNPTAPTPVPVPVPPPIAEPPALVCPANVATATTAAQGSVVTYSVPAATGGEAPVTVTCAPSSNSLFAIGTTPVQCTATDARSRTASCSFSVAVTRTPQLSRTRFMAFGDSFTAGEVTAPLSGAGVWGSQQSSTRLIVVPTASYPSVLAGLLRQRYTAQIGSISVVNEGVSGEAAQVATTRFTQAFRTHSPEVVMLLQGVVGLTLPAGASSAAAAISTMAAEARNRGARVLIAAYPPPGPGFRTVPDAAIRDYNERMRQVARSEGAILVDLYAALGVNPSQYIGIDGLHPNEAGYRKMADTFFASIQAQLEIPVSPVAQNRN